MLGGLQVDYEELRPKINTCDHIEVNLAELRTIFTSTSIRLLDELESR